MKARLLPRLLLAALAAACAGRFDRVGLDAAAQEIAAGIAFGPAPNDETAKGDDLPRLELGRPGGHFFGVFLHVLLDARLVGLANGADLGRKLEIVGLGDRLVLPEALAVIM